MSFRYDNYEDASQQLDRCVMLTDKGYAVYLKVYEGWNWQVKNLSNGNISYHDLREVGLTFSPLVLGYVNTGSGALYLVRTPRRMWKQGISSNNVTANNRPVSNEIMRSETLNDCLMNVFPSMQEAYEVAKEIGIPRAFHKDFAFNPTNGRGICLDYKGESVGKLDDNLDIELKSPFHYVQEVFEEVVNAQD